MIIISVCIIIMRVSNAEESWSQGSFQLLQRCSILRDSIWVNVKKIVRGCLYITTVIRDIYKSFYLWVYHQVCNSNTYILFHILFFFFSFSMGTFTHKWLNQCQNQLSNSSRALYFFLTQSLWCVLVFWQKPTTSVVQLVYTKPNLTSVIVSLLK